MVEAAEPNTILYCLGKHRKKEGLYYTLEMYKDMEAFTLHGRQEHIRQMRTAQEAHMEGEPKVRVLVPMNGYLTRVVGPRLLREAPPGVHRNLPDPGDPYKKPAPPESPGAEPSSSSRRAKL